jgi:hypothetical protein
MSFTAVLTALLPGIADADLNAGLAAYFSFDQGKTYLMKDLSGTGNDGIVLMISSCATDFDNVQVEGEPATVSASSKLAVSWGYLKAR